MRRSDSVVLALLGLMMAGAALGAVHEKHAPRLNGRGTIAGGQPVDFVLQLACEGSGPSELTVWGGGGMFVLSEPISVLCRDDPGIEPGLPSAGFDTLIGGGGGTWKGRRGAYASFTFADAGKGALPDYAEITITAPDGRVVLDVAGVVRGNLDARGTPTRLEEPGEDPVDALHSAVIGGQGRSWGYRFARLPRALFGREGQAIEEKPGGVPSQPPKLDPALAELLARGDLDERALVLLNLRDDVVLRQLPDLWRFLRCDNPLGLQFQRAVRERIAVLRGLRQRATRAFLGDFRCGVHDIRIVRQSWLVNGFLADVRLGDVPALAERDDVIFVELSDKDIPPPMDDGDPGNDIAVGRQLINSDILATQPGMNGGCIGLLDTGVRATHVLFTAPPDDNVRILADCDAGGPSCLDPTHPQFGPGDGRNHGTGTASILSGNEVYGPPFRGVTDILIDSWKVYNSGTTAVVGIGQATVTALERAIASMNRVIVVEIQDPVGHTGLLATASDNAFDLGAVVVAAAGNCAVDDSCLTPTGTPRPATIRSPASAHKVLGIGAYNLVNGVTGDYQSYGPTTDLRIKPELQAPTDAETASQCGPGDNFTGPRACILPLTPDLSLWRLGGTSGSTPFAGGFAALVRNWLRKFGTWQPGNTYARMILKGDLTDPYDEREGAGRLRLDPCTLSYWGAVSFTPPTPQSFVPVVQIPIPTTHAWDRIEAAIWWPEQAVGFHNDVDLYLLDPNLVEAAKGVHDTSVFERVEVASPSIGTWTVKIKSYVQPANQLIYWAVDLVDDPHPTLGCEVAITPGDLPPALPDP